MVIIKLILNNIISFMEVVQENIIDADLLSSKKRNYIFVYVL